MKTSSCVVLSLVYLSIVANFSLVDVVLAKTRQQPTKQPGKRRKGQDWLKLPPEFVKDSRWDCLYQCRAIVGRDLKDCAFDCYGGGTFRGLHAHCDNSCKGEIPGGFVDWIRLTMWSFPFQLSCFLGCINSGGLVPPPITYEWY